MGNSTKRNTLNLDEVSNIISHAKVLAKQYRDVTGRPLGITGEVAEYEAARLLGLELAMVRQSGYDAIRLSNRRVEHLQIKGRCVLSRNPGQRIGKIDLGKKWDYVVLVLLDADFEPLEIYEAKRNKVKEALTKPGSKARNERGALSVAQFKAIAKLVWLRTDKS